MGQSTIFKIATRPRFKFPANLTTITTPSTAQSIHVDSIKRALVSDTYTANALVSMYGKSGLLGHARQLFEEIPHPDVVSWNSVLSSCFRCGDCEGAGELFEKMSSRNEVSWATMVSGYVRNGCFYQGLCAFQRMLTVVSDDDGCAGRLNLCPNVDTLTSVISGCAKLREIRFGEQVHCYIKKTSSCSERDLFIGSALIELYGKCGFVLLSQRVFNFMVEKCVVVWSTLISVYVNNDNHMSGVEIFREMMCDSADPNLFTLTMIMNACGTMKQVHLGKELHCFVLKRMDGPNLYLSTSLISMYSRCSLVKYASQVFEKAKKSTGLDGISLWNSMMVGYLENGLVDEARSTLRSVTRFVKPNCITIAVILPMFIQSASLLPGKEVHCYAIKNGLDEQVQVGNCLVDMYSKCGKIEWAISQFDRMKERNCVSWATMINGFGIHGNGEAAINLFETLVEKGGLRLDSGIFVALLSACSHSGLVEEGLKYFSSMKDFGLHYTSETYGCMVDLLARAGYITQAKKFISLIPCNASPSMFGALLGSCRIHGNVNDAEVVSKKLSEMKVDEIGFQALLSNIYAECVCRVREGRGCLMFEEGNV